MRKRGLGALATARGIAGLVLAFAVLGGVGRADDYPSRPVKLVLPQPPGGAVDLIARVLGDHLAGQLKQPVIIENMQGGNGQVAAGAVARAAPDGHTLLMAVDNILVINPHLNPVTYDPFRDFVPIGVVANLYVVLVTNPNKVPGNSVRELIDHARAHPGKLNYGSLGIGFQQHLGMELFQLMTKTKMNNVSYRGTAQAMTDVVAGVVDLMLTGPPSAKAMSEGGKLRMLAVAAPERLNLLPEVPTMAEAGIPGYELRTWFGLLAPAKTPNAVVDRLSQEIRTAASNPKFIERMKSQGIEPVVGTRGEMAATMQADFKRWRDFIAQLGIKAAP
jgi:tripartite-type tricarboxylate transporter receptor subunit TctC